MACVSPQTEHGFTQIANKLLDQVISFSFTKRQYKVLLYVIRQTYGYRKKADDMSYGRIAEHTQLTRRDVIRTVQALQNANVITVTATGRYVHGGEINSIAINKHYDQWQTGETKASDPEPDYPRMAASRTSGKTPTSGDKRLVAKQHETSGKTVIRLVAKHPPTKESNTKERKKGAERKRSSLVTIDEYLTQCRADGVQAIRPDSAVMRYASEAGISSELLRICFYEFVERYRSKGKKQRDWPATFLNCVRANWYRLWWIDDNSQCQATSLGRQAMKVHEERRHASQ